MSTAELVLILQKFGVAETAVAARQIDQVATTHPSPFNTLVSFRYQKKHWFVLFDDTAEDRVSYIMGQLRTHQNELSGELLQNPLESAIHTYGLPLKGKDVYLFKVTSDKQRLDGLLAITRPELSRSTWQKYIKAGRVDVNGQKQLSPKVLVSPEAKIEVHYPAEANYQDKTLPILYRDDDVIVIDKPAGLLSHSKGALNEEFTVADFFRRFTTWGLETNRPGIVHRLDRDTSGVLIGARNEAAAHFLQRQFADRKVKKTYYAVLAGVPKLTKAEIDIPIGRNLSAPGSFRADSKGRPAVTRYEVLAITKHQALVRLQPATGRTHQLRVHMAYLKTPIKGDRMYGKVSDRLYLHAASLEITLPNGQRHTFKAKLPMVFRPYLPKDML